MPLEAARLDPAEILVALHAVAGRQTPSSAALRVTQARELIDATMDRDVRRAPPTDGRSGGDYLLGRSMEIRLSPTEPDATAYDRDLEARAASLALSTVLSGVLHT